MDDVTQQTFKNLTKDLIKRLKKASEPRLCEALVKNCVYVVTCSKKWFQQNGLKESSKDTEEDWYLMIFTEALEDMLYKKTHISVQMFAQIITAFPETAVKFLDIVRKVAFGSEVRVHKKTLAFDVMTLAIKQIMAKEDASSPLWIDISSDILPKVVFAVSTLNPQELKPLYAHKLLNVLFVIAQIGKRICHENLLDNSEGLVEALNALPRNRLKNDCKKIIRKLIFLVSGDPMQHKKGKKREKKGEDSTKKKKKSEVC